MIRRHHWKCIGLSLVLILLFSGAVSAQRNPVWTSIDLLVAQADRVVIGRIADMGEAHGRHQPIVLAVEETLKGEPVSRLPLDVEGVMWQRLDRGKVLCSTCAEHTHRLLFTVGHWQNYPRTVNVVDLDDPSVVDVTGDLRLLTTGGDIAQAAREEVRRSPGVFDDKQIFEWGQPSNSFLTGTRLHGLTIYVPVDERQEQLAYRVLASQRTPTSVVGANANDRANAVRVLAFFRSAENIRLVKSLLDDPQIEHAAMGQLDYPSAAQRIGYSANGASLSPHA